MTARNLLFGRGVRRGFHGVIRGVINVLFMGIFIGVFYCEALQLFTQR